jgi:hypothetical protein
VAVLSEQPLLSLASRRPLLLNDYERRSEVYVVDRPAL